MSVQAPDSPDLQRRDDDEFQHGCAELLKEAEALRLRYMKQHSGREMVAMTLSLLAIVAGAGGFGWFFFMNADLVKALASMTLALSIPVILALWSRGPLRAYKQAHKDQFMPHMAKILGGFQFHPARGISAKVLARTGIVPAHDIYKAEDCFMGRYKGVKVIFSEARLYTKGNRRDPVFSGLFALLEIPQEIFEGHTIITADPSMVARWQHSRWQKLSPVTLSPAQKSHDRFSAFSDQPQEAVSVLGERLIKELAEASEIFDDAALSAVFFRGKYVFLAIPYPHDMFEASNLHVPVTTSQYAMTCKKEVEKLLEIIDVFDLYKSQLAD